MKALRRAAEGKIATPIDAITGPDLVRARSELFVDGRLEAGRLFEDIQERSRAIHSIAFRIAYPFYDTRTF